jgi:hypothetical protein
VDGLVGEGGTNGRQLITVQKNTKMWRSMEEKQENKKDGCEEDG